MTRIQGTLVVCAALALVACSGGGGVAEVEVVLRQPSKWHQRKRFIPRKGPISSKNSSAIILTAPKMRVMQ